MKAYSIYTALFFSLMLLLFSCKKSDLITYQGKRALYFSIESTDSVSINFSILPNEVKDTVLKIPIELLGLKLNAAEPFNVHIDEQITTAIKGSDFELPGQFSFPAEKSSDTIRVRFIRTAKLAQREYVLGLELTPTTQFNNEAFESSQTNAQSAKVRVFITDIFKPTAKWANAAGRLGTEHYLGRFTKKKILLITEIFGAWGFKEMYLKVDTYPSYFGDLLNNYLKTQKAAGTPVLEDDGTLMEVGPFYK